MQTQYMHGMIWLWLRWANIVRIQISIHFLTQTFAMNQLLLQCVRTGNNFCVLTNNFCRWAIRHCTRQTSTLPLVNNFYIKLQNETWTSTIQIQMLTSKTFQMWRRMNEWMGWSERFWKTAKLLVLFEHRWSPHMSCSILRSYRKDYLSATNLNVHDIVCTYYGTVNGFVD